MIDLETLKFLQSAQENLFPAMEMKQGGMIDFAAKFKHTLEQCFNYFSFVLNTYKPGMCGAELFPVGRGGAKMKIRGAGRRWKSAGQGKKTRKSTDPKIWQMWVFRIVMEIFVVYYDVLMN